MTPPTGIRRRPTGVRHRSRAILAYAVLGACLAVGLTGCGRDDDREQARSVTQRFFQALRQHDWASACALLDEDTRHQLMSQERAPCLQAVRSLQAPGAAVSRVQVFITSAKVDLAGGESAFLDQGPQGWRLSALGCKPQAGKPADVPFDCDLEA